jgi:hypothetical protein
VTGPRQIDVFAQVLASHGPNAALPAKNRIFAPFIGSWDLIVRWQPGVARSIQLLVPPQDLPILGVDQSVIITATAH